MIDTNIISSIGAGSGIDTKNLVKQLVELEGAAKQQRIDTKREETEASISDFGFLKSSLSTLQTSLDALTDPEGLFSKSASLTETDAIVPEELGTGVSTGTYTLEVLDTAQAQSLSSVRFDDPSDAVGKGTLTFQLGNWDLGAGTFAVNADSASHTITIDDNNNTLEGLRDAINDADFGVQASIVNDGSGYRLLMTAPSGATNEIAVSVVEDAGTPTNTDAYGLSRFAFDEAGKQLVNTQEGRDAKVKINGLEVSRSSNLIDDVIEGFSFSVVKSAPGEVTTMTITDDKAYAEQKIREFVAAYNSFYDAIRPMFTHDATLPEDSEISAVGSLASDALAKSVVSQIKTVIASAVPGLGDDGLNALSTIGIHTAKDDTLYFAKDHDNEEYFGRAMDENFEMVQELFGPTTSSTASGVVVNSYQDRTVPGTYDVVIDQTPTKGYLMGAAVPAVLDTTGKDYSFTIEVDGVESGSLTLAAGQTFGTTDELVAELQTLINSDAALQEKRAEVTVSYEGGKFVFTSAEYGSKTSVVLVSASAQFKTDFGMSDGMVTAEAGRDVAGSVDGVEAFGVGNVLLPDLQSKASGMSLIVGENAVSGTVSYSRGFAGELSALINRFQQDDGAIGTRTETLEDQLVSLDQQQARHDRRMSAFQERMMEQFIAMENILNGLDSSGGFLENLMDTLPFTASND